MNSELSHLTAGFLENQPRVIAEGSSHKGMVATKFSVAGTIVQALIQDGDIGTEEIYWTYLREGESSSYHLFEVSRWDTPFGKNDIVMNIPRQNVPDKDSAKQSLIDHVCDAYKSGSFPVDLDKLRAGLEKHLE